MVLAVLIAASTGPNFVTNYQTDNCGRSATECFVSVSLSNIGGSSEGGVVSVNAMTAHIEIGSYAEGAERFDFPVSCQAPLPPIAHGAVAHLGCRLAVPLGTPSGHHIVASTVAIDVTPTR